MECATLLCDLYRVVALELPWFVGIQRLAAMQDGLNHWVLQNTVDVLIRGYCYS